MQTYERGPLLPLPQVPESVIVLPDNVAKHHEVQVQFFNDVADALGYASDEARQLCEVRPRYLARPIDGGETDDLCTELRLAGRTVAGVFEIRTEFNYTQIMYGLFITEKDRDRLSYRPIA